MDDVVSVPAWHPYHTVSLVNRYGADPARYMFTVPAKGGARPLPSPLILRISPTYPSTEGLTPSGPLLVVILEAGYRLGKLHLVGG